MKGKELFDVINDIDESIVSEIYEEPVRPEVYRIEPSRGGWIKPAIASAACLAVVAGAIGAAKLGGGEQLSSADYTEGITDPGAASAGGYAYNGKYSKGSDYPNCVRLDENSPFFDSTHLEDYDEWNYGNFRNLPLILPNNYDHDRDGSLYNNMYDCTLYHPFYRVWEPVDNSVLCADYVEELGCDVPAFHSGEVVYAGAASKGNTVIIKHSDNDYSLYGYLDELRVKVGDTVDKGQTIASTGDAAVSGKDYCYLTLWHGLRAIDISEWNRYIDSREGLDSQWLPINGWLYGDYMDYLKTYYPEAFEESERFGGDYAKVNNLPRFKNYGGISWEQKVLGENQFFLQYNDGDDLFIYSEKSFITLKWGTVGIVTVNQTGEAVTQKDGKVVYAGESDFGNVVIVGHDFNDYTLYGYTAASDGELKVNFGDTVRAGQALASGGDYTVWEVTGEVTVDNWNECMAELADGVHPVFADPE